MPLEFGASTSSFVSFTQHLNSSRTAVGGGGFATAYMGLDPDVLRSFFCPMDIYIGLGLAFTSVPSGFFTNSGLGLATFEGVNHFLSDFLAVFVECAYWSYASGAAISLLIKF